MTKITQDDIECWKAIFSLTNEQMDVEGDDKRGLELLAAHREAERRAIVEWLREEARLCDCFAREAGECACGAWDDYKTMPVERLADAIENKEHRNDD